MHDGLLFEERYNLLNAFFATVPGNRHFNLRYLWLLNANYADYSFLFTLHTGERQNKHLKAEYLAVLETNHRTPYFLNLHYQDTAHTVVLGRTGSGKSFFLNFLHHESTEVRPLHVHLRSGREFSQRYTALRRRLSKGQRGAFGIHDQSVFTGADT
jgi:type IV secretion system protein VirB4